MLRSFVVCGLFSVIGCAREEEVTVDLIPLPNAQPTVLVGEASPAKAEPSAALTVATSAAMVSTSAAVQAEPKRLSSTTMLSTTKPATSAPPHLPVATKSCEAPPPACAGAIGFCPSWDCVDGKWVSKPRPNRAPCAGTVEACRGSKSKPGDSL